VLRSEINRVRNAADKMRERLSTSRPAAAAEAPREVPRAAAPREVPSDQPREVPQQREVPFSGLHEVPQENGAHYDDDDAHTQVINGVGGPRHRRDFT
jgi:hypothetical protein